MTEQHPFAPAARPVRTERQLATLGIVMIIAAMTIIPVMDGIAKHLTHSFDPMQVVWARYFFHFILFLPFVLWRYGSRTFRLQRPGLQLVRGGFLLISTICFFSAVQTMALADTLAVVFVYPFVVTALAPVLLGDQVGRLRWAAVAVGFAGALLVIRPGFNSLSVATIFALGAGVGYACYVLATRKLAGSDPVLVTLLMTGFVGTIVSTIAVPWFWQTPSPEQFALMVLIGFLAACGHYLIILAHEYASAPQLAPYAYVEIVSATIVGLIAFGDFPDAITWTGIGIIVCSGMFIAWREAVRGVVR